MQYNRYFRNALLAVGALLGNVSDLWSQAAPMAEPVAEKPSIYTSPIFYALAIVAFILLVFIVQLGRVLSTVATNYSKGDGSSWDRLKTIVVLIALSLAGSTEAFAQAATATANAAAPAKEATPVLDFLHEGFGVNALNALAVIIFIELFVILYLVRMIKLFIIKEKEVLSAESVQKVHASVFWDKFNASVAIEKESSVMTDHEYDGIRELDNALPPWWKYGFYLTIVWSLVYLVYYHVSNGPSSQDEYKAQLEEGAASVAAYRAKAKNLVDETNVKVLSEAADLSAGQSVFTQYCAVCHGPDGGGLVGPNLTDQYWLHGGDIKDLFKTIKYGVQGKGMKSWQQELSPVMMAQVASYIKTLTGTKPANPKAPEGELWTEVTNAPAAGDSTASVVDSTAANPAPAGVVQ